MSEPQLLRLLAQDETDLSVVSTTVQDAICKIGDISYEAKARRLTLALNRFRWEAGARTDQRVRCGLQVGAVLGVKERNLRQDAKRAVVELLAVTFEPGEPPGGHLVLAFAGGGDLRVEVECIDIALADLSPPWPAAQRPDHEER